MSDNPENGIVEPKQLSPQNRSFKNGNVITQSILEAVCNDFQNIGVVKSGTFENLRKKTAIFSAVEVSETDYSNLVASTSKNVEINPEDSSSVCVDFIADKNTSVPEQIEANYSSLNNVNTAVHEQCETSVDEIIPSVSDQSAEPERTYATLSSVPPQQCKTMLETDAENCFILKIALKDKDISKMTKCNINSSLNMCELNKCQTSNVTSGKTCLIVESNVHGSASADTLLATAAKLLEKSVSNILPHTPGIVGMENIVTTNQTDSDMKTFSPVGKIGCKANHYSSHSTAENCNQPGGSFQVESEVEIMSSNVGKWSLEEKSVASNQNRIGMKLLRSPDIVPEAKPSRSSVGNYKTSSEIRNTKSRRVSAKMKKAWATTLQNNGIVSCPVLGCYQTYVTVANLQTHYKWCTGKKSLQHCSYCSSLIIADHDAVLHHMEVEHPDKLEEYKAGKLLVKEAPSKSLPEITEANFLAQNEHNNLSSENIVGHRFHRKRRKVNSAAKVKFRAKENILRPKKSCLKQNHKSYERKQYGFKRSRKSVRFDAVLQKINSVAKEPDAVKAIEASQNISSSRGSLNKKADFTASVNESTKDDFEFSTEELVDYHSGHTGNVTLKKSLANVQINLQGYKILDQYLKQHQDLSEHETFSRNKNSISDKKSRPRVCLNNQGYQIFSEYLKLTRDWASERKTYSRSRCSSVSDSPPISTTDPKNIMDDHQMNVTPITEGISLNVSNGKLNTNVMSQCPVDTLQSQNSFSSGQLLQKAAHRNKARSKNPNALSQPSLLELCDHAILTNQQKSVEISTVDKSFTSEEINFVANQSVEPLDNVGDNKCDNLALLTNLYKPLIKTRVTCYDNAVQRFGTLSKPPISISSPITYGKTIPQSNATLPCSPFTVPDFDTLLKNHTISPPVLKKRKGRPPKNRNLENLSFDQLPKNIQVDINKAKCIRQNGIKLPPQSINADGIVKRKRGRPKKNTLPVVLTPVEDLTAKGGAAADYNAVSQRTKITKLENNVKNVKKSRGRKKIVCTKKTRLQQSVLKWKMKSQSRSMELSTGHQSETTILEMRCDKQIGDISSESNNGISLNASEGTEYEKNVFSIKTQVESDNIAAIVTKPKCTITNPQNMLHDIDNVSMSSVKSLGVGMNNLIMPDSGIELSAIVEVCDDTLNLENTNLVNTTPLPRKKLEKNILLSSELSEEKMLTKESVADDSCREKNALDVQHLNQVSNVERLVITHVPINKTLHVDDIDEKITNEIACNSNIPDCILQIKKHFSGEVDDVSKKSTGSKDDTKEHNVTSDVKENVAFFKSINENGTAAGNDNTENIRNSYEKCLEDHRKYHNIVCNKKKSFSSPGQDKLSESLTAEVGNALDLNDYNSKYNAVGTSYIDTSTDEKRSISTPSSLTESGEVMRQTATEKEINVLLKSSVIEKNYDSKCVVQCNLDNQNSTYVERSDSELTAFATSEVNNVVHSLPTMNSEEITMLQERVNVAGTVKKRKGRPRKGQDIRYSLKSSHTTICDIDCLGKERTDIEECASLMNNTQISDLNNTTDSCLNKPVIDQGDCNILDTVSETVVAKQAENEHIASDKSTNCDNAQSGQIADSNVNDLQSNLQPKKKGRKRGYEANYTPKVTPFSDNLQVTGRRTSTRNRKIKRYDSDEDIYQTNKTGTKESAKKVKVQETPRKRGRPRKYPIKENCLKSESNSDNRMHISNSERKAELLKDSQSISATWNATSNTDHLKHSTRKCSRKGRPRKCVRYADLNSGMDSDILEDDSSALDLLDNYKSIKKGRLDKKLASQDGLIKSKFSEKESGNTGGTLSRDVEDEFGKEKFVQNLNMVLLNKVPQTLDINGKTFNKNVTTHSKIICKEDRIAGKKRKCTLFKSVDSKFGGTNLRDNEKSYSKKRNTEYICDLDSCNSEDILPVNDNAHSPKKRTTRRAAMNARRRLVNLMDTDKTKKLSTLYNDKESSDDDYHPTLDEIQEKEVDEDDTFFFKDTSVECIKEELSKYKDYFHAPEVIERVVTPELLQKWCRMLDKDKKIVCEIKGCGKALETKPGMIYHYTHAPCLKAQEKWKCLICDKEFRPGHRLMLRHLLRWHFNNTDDPTPTKTTALKKNLPVSDFNGIESTMEFYREFSYQDLMMDWKPKKSLWNLQSVQDYEPYLPPARTSVNVKIENIGRNSVVQESNWSKLNCFESLPGTAESCHHTIFAGGPILSAAWCPTPVSIEASQYIALATANVMEPDSKLLETDVGNGLVQIWSFGKLENNTCIKPSFSIGISHQHGCIHDMAWCPSGCWDNPNKDSNILDDVLPRMGLLAISCADSCIRIYSIPHPSSLPCASDNLPIFSSPASVVLQSFSNGPCLISMKSMCTSVSWQRTNGCELVAGGFSNGMICVWHLASSSPLLAVSHKNFQSVLVPFLSFQGHVAAITGLSFASLHGGRWIASCGLDSSLKTWDLEDTSLPVSTFKKSNMKRVQWISHWNGQFVTKHDNNPSSLFKECGYYDHMPRNLTLHNAPVSSTSVSEWLNAVVSCDVAGEVCGMALGQLLKCSDNHKQSSDRRFPIFQTDCRLLEDRGSPAPDNFIKKSDPPANKSDLHHEKSCTSHVNTTSIAKSIPLAVKQVMEYVLEKIEVENTSELRYFMPQHNSKCFSSVKSISVLYSGQKGADKIPSYNIPLHFNPSKEIDVVKESPTLTESNVENLVISQVENCNFLSQTELVTKNPKSHLVSGSVLDIQAQHLNSHRNLTGASMADLFSTLDSESTEEECIEKKISREVLQGILKMASLSVPGNEAESKIFYLNTLSNKSKENTMNLADTFEESKKVCAMILGKIESNETISALSSEIRTGFHKNQSPVLVKETNSLSSDYQCKIVHNSPVSGNTNDLNKDEIFFMMDKVSQQQKSKQKAKVMQSLTNSVQVHSGSEVEHQYIGNPSIRESLEGIKCENEDDSELNCSQGDVNEYADNTLQVHSSSVYEASTIQHNSFQISPEVITNFNHEPVDLVKIQHLTSNEMLVLKSIVMEILEGIISRVAGKNANANIEMLPQTSASYLKTQTSYSKTSNVVVPEGLPSEVENIPLNFGASSQLTSKCILDSNTDVEVPDLVSEIDKHMPINLVMLPQATSNSMLNSNTYALGFPQDIATDATEKSTTLDIVILSQTVTNVLPDIHNEAMEVRGTVTEVSNKGMSMNLDVSSEICTNPMPDPDADAARVLQCMVFKVAGKDMPRSVDISPQISTNDRFVSDSDVAEVLQSIVAKVVDKDMSVNSSEPLQISANNMPDSEFDIKVLRNTVTEIAKQNMPVSCNAPSQISVNRMPVTDSDVLEALCGVISQIVDENMSMNLGMPIQIPMNRRCHSNIDVVKVLKDIVSQVADKYRTVNLDVKSEIPSYDVSDTDVMEILKNIVFEVSDREKCVPINLNKLQQTTADIACDPDYGVKEVVGDMISKITNDGNPMGLPMSLQTTVCEKPDANCNSGKTHESMVSEVSSIDIPLDLVLPPLETSDKGFYSDTVVEEVLKGIVSEVVIKDIPMNVEMSAQATVNKKFYSVADVEISTNMGSGKAIKDIPMNLVMLPPTNADRILLAEDMNVQEIVKVVASKLSDNDDLRPINSLVLKQKHALHSYTDNKSITEDRPSEMTVKDKAGNFVMLQQRDINIMPDSNTVVRETLECMIADAAVKSDDIQKELNLSPQVINNNISDSYITVKDSANGVVSEISTEDLPVSGVTFPQTTSEDNPKSNTLVKGILEDLISVVTSKEDDISLNFSMPLLAATKSISESNAVAEEVLEISKIVDEGKNKLGHLYRFPQSIGNDMPDLEGVEDVLGEMIAKVAGKDSNLPKKSNVLPQTRSSNMFYPNVDVPEIFEGKVSENADEISVIPIGVNILPQTDSGNALYSNANAKEIPNCTMSEIASKDGSFMNMTDLPHLKTAVSYLNIIGEILTVVISKIISIYEGTPLNSSVLSQAIAESMPESNIVGELIMDIVSQVIIHDRVMSVDLSILSQITANGMSDLNIIGELVKDVVSQVVFKYKDLAVNFNVLLETTSHQACGSNIVVSDVVSQVVSKYKGMSMNLDHCHVISLMHLSNSNVIQDIVKGIISNVSSHKESMGSFLMNSILMNETDLICIKTVIADIKEQINIKKNESRICVPELGSNLSCSSITKGIIGNRICNANNHDKSVGSCPTMNTDIMDDCYFVEQKIEGTKDQVIIEKRVSSKNFELCPHPLDTILMKPQNLIDSLILKDSDISSSIICDKENLCNASCSQNSSKGNTVNIEDCEQFTFTCVETSIKDSDMKFTMDKQLDSSNLRALCSSQSNSTVVQECSSNLSQIGAFNSVNSPTDDNSMVAESVKDFHNEGLCFEDNTNDNSPPLGKYDAMSRKYGLVFKDIDLCDFYKIPASEFNRLRRVDCLTPIAPDKYPLSSINVVQWNPNYGSHLCLFTGGQSGVARLSFLSGLPSAENNGFWSSRRQKRSMQQNR